MKKVLAIITAIMMMVIMMPFGAMAEQAEEETWNSYTLYNYISIGNGRTYISLETQENGIKTHKSAEEFHKENGNKRYDLDKDEYRIAGYDLTGLVIVHNGIRYVEKSAAKEGQPYFTAKLDRVEAVPLANYSRPELMNEKTSSAAGWALADLILMIGTIVAAGFGIRNRKHMAVIMASASAVIFLLTQYMGGDMGIVDKWTVLMGAVFAAGTMMAAAGRKTEER